MPMWAGNAGSAEWDIGLTFSSLPSCPGIAMCAEEEEEEDEPRTVESGSHLMFLPPLPLLLLLLTLLTLLALTAVLTRGLELPPGLASPLSPLLPAEVERSSC